jgi:chitinase
LIAAYVFARHPTKGANCGGYALHAGPSPSLRGLMTWSMNWDRYYDWSS